MEMVVFYIILAYAFYRGIRGNIRTLLSVRFLLQLQKKNSGSAKQSQKKLIILIPVLREQEIIEKTFRRFSSLKGDFKVVFITTQKEDYEYRLRFEKLKYLKRSILNAKNEGVFLGMVNGIFPLTQAKTIQQNINSSGNEEEVWKSIIKEYKNKPHTRDILKKLLETSTVNIRRRVSIVDYPYTEGAMAHQLNYACSRILKEARPEDIYIAVYNADSEVSDTWVSRVRSYIGMYPEVAVIQQSSLFTFNFNDFSKSLSGDFLRGISLLQTRWTFAHELPRIIKQFNSKLGSFVEGAHVVGHGLILRLDALSKVELFPVAFINEDLPLGFLLRLQGEKIYPFPYLENSESPTTIRSMFKQYQTWFYGVGEYLSYMKFAWKKVSYNKIQVVLWGLKYIIRSVLWLLMSCCWLFLFFYPLFVGSFWLFCLVIISFLVYAPLNFVIIQVLLNKHGASLMDINEYKISIPFRTLVSSLFVYLTHSYGPILATKELLMRFLFKKHIYKNKTER